MGRPLVPQAFLERPYWADTVAPEAAELSADLPKRVDVAIVGAGFCGLSAALAAAKAGASVVVLERNGIAWGASSRNGGMALTGLKVAPDALRAKFGAAIARRLFDASLASVDAIERIAREESIACDFQRCGHLEVAVKPSHFAGLTRVAAMLEREFGHRVRLIARGELGGEIGSERYHGGLVDESSAGLNPARLAHGLAAAARRRGVAIAQQTPVDAIERAGAAGTAAFLVRSPRGDVRADRVFVATGAYTGPLTPRLRRRVIPIGSYVIATEPLDASTAARLIPRGRMVFDSNNFLHYYRLTPDRRMLFGGRAAFVPETERTVRDSAEILRRDMVAVFPQLRDAGVAYAWGGTIDFTFDMLPHAGALDGLFYAMGFAGHGVAMATYLGERMGSALTASGAASEEALPTGPLPGAPLGLYGGDPWFLPLAGAWYRLLDWAS